MKSIGGLFPVIVDSGEHDYISPLKEGSVVPFMSGRCAILYALRDLEATHKLDSGKVSFKAYLPAYTCETVLNAFLKDGVDVRFYRVDEALRPHWDSAVLNSSDVLLLSGYYGYKTYETGYLDEKSIDDFEAFLAKLKANGLTLFFDLTHTAFDRRPLPKLWDYAAGSLRKWMGVYSGGFALKNSSAFAPDIPTLPADEKHIALRRKALELAGQSFNANTLEEQTALREQSTSVFWEGELYLRRIFDVFRSDADSLNILRHTDFDAIRERRRGNYKHLVARLKDGLGERKGNWMPFSLELTDEICPSHFTLFCEDREALVTYLSKQKIGSSVYWPILEPLTGELRRQTAAITDRVLSVSCDQRYGTEDMDRLADALLAYQMK